jgi:hypothetical protein
MLGSEGRRAFEHEDEGTSYLPALHFRIDDRSEEQSLKN